MEQETVVYDRAQEPVVLSKGLFDLLLKQDKPADLIALYGFYYYTAKWQQTNQPRCTTTYVANALHWNRAKVIQHKNTLTKLGLVQDCQRKDDTGKITGYYIKVHFIWGQDKTAENGEFFQCLDLGTVEKTAKIKGNGVDLSKIEKFSAVPENQCMDFGYTNALNNNNKNALNTNTNGRAKNKIFSPPTLEEVEDYFRERGYEVSRAKQAFDYYDVADWHDSYGNPVRNWKQKMITVWMRDEYKVVVKPVSNLIQLK